MTKEATAAGGAKTHAKARAHHPTCAPKSPGGAAFDAALGPVPTRRDPPATTKPVTTAGHPTPPVPVPAPEDASLATLDADQTRRQASGEVARVSWGLPPIPGFGNLDRDGDGLVSQGEMAAARRHKAGPETPQPDALLWALRQAVSASDGLLDAARGEG